MSESTTRYGFALLCALGMLAIGLGAVLEIARFRRHAAHANSFALNGVSSATPSATSGGNLLSLRQFRLRLFSAVLWMMILGALYYAVTVQWPVRHGPIPTSAEIEQARRFAMTLICAFAGMFVGFGLLTWDMIQLGRERQAQSARFQAGLADLARREAERIQTIQAQNRASPASSKASPTDQASPTDADASTDSGDAPSAS